MNPEKELINFAINDNAHAGGSTSPTFTSSIDEEYQQNSDYRQ